MWINDYGWKFSENKATQNKKKKCSQCIMRQGMSTQKKEKKKTRSNKLCIVATARMMMMTPVLIKINYGMVVAMYMFCTFGIWTEAKQWTIHSTTVYVDTACYCCWWCSNWVFIRWNTSSASFFLLHSFSFSFLPLSSIE